MAFDANEFKRFADAPVRMSNALEKNALNEGMGFNLDAEYMNTATVTATPSDNCQWVDPTLGKTICGTFNLGCIEKSDGR